MNSAPRIKPGAINLKFMDPNLFYLDWARLTEVLVSIIVLAFFVERALNWLFELELYKKSLHKFKIKPYIALAVSYFICYAWKFDALSIVFVQESTGVPGYLITAGIIAGGSKGAIVLFENLKIIKKQVDPDPPNPSNPDSK